MSTSFLHREKCVSYQGRSKISNSCFILGTLGGSLKDLFYIYKFRLLQIQDFCTLNISLIPISSSLTIHPESWKKEKEKKERNIERTLGDSLWEELVTKTVSLPPLRWGLWCLCCFFFSSLTKGWAITACLTWRTQEDRVATHSYPSPTVS